MTKEEAFAYFHHRKVFCEDRLKNCPKDSIARKEKELYDKAIKALEQETILDKIREEVEGHKSAIDNAISEDESKIEGMKEAYKDCLDTIDKYKEESEAGE
jgi:hypothetical protein